MQPGRQLGGWQRHTVATSDGALEPWLDRRFIAHSYACRPGKGAHRAVDYYQRQARRYPYVLKVDIARYFPSINCAILGEPLRRYVADPALLGVLERILDASPRATGRGG